MSDVVTGEAVVVEVRIAQLPSRALALLIDVAVQTALVIGANVLLANASLAADEALDTALRILLNALILVGYPVIFETLTRGRSLGKLALGLRVVSDDGGPERFRQALFRGLAGVPEIWLFGGAPALISALVSQQGKRLGDLFAGTMVISERGPRDRVPPPMMPPQLAGWASTLELSQLPDEVANTARQYLSRWHQLAPAVRHDMGSRIAGQVAAYVTPPPPPGVPHHAYLSAVLAERRRRAEIRLAGRAGHLAPPPPSPPGSTPPRLQASTQPVHAPSTPPHPMAPQPVSPQPESPYPMAPYPMSPQPSQSPPSPPALTPPAGHAPPTPGGFVPPS